MSLGLHQISNIRIDIRIARKLYNTSKGQLSTQLVHWHKR